MALQTNLIFLYADSLKRDFSTCYIIREKLLSIGIKSFICSRRNFDYLIKFFAPKKILLIGQVNMLSPRLLEFSRKGFTKIYFLPAEGVAEYSEYETMYPKSNIYNHINTIYFWGIKPFSWFKSNREVDNEYKLKLLGYNRFPIAKAYSEIFKGNKIKLGFIGRFPIMNDLYKRNPMDFFLIENSLAEVNKAHSRMKSETTAMFLYLQIFKKIFEEYNYIISYRPHPNENSDTYKILASRYKSRFELNQENDVSEWISDCDKIIGGASSSFIDASIQKKPVICIDDITKTKSMTSVFDPFLNTVYDYSYNPKNIDELFNLIIDEELKPRNNLNYNRMINDNLKGDTNLVFDKIFSDLTNDLSKLNILDYMFFQIIISVDLILSLFKKVFNIESLGFDYSFFFHKPSDKLKRITQIINNKY